MVLRKAAILSTLFIFGMIGRAWCDPVKSMNGGAVPLTTTKIDKNKTVMLKKTEPPTEPAEWSKKIQANLRNVDFLKIPEEKKKSRWMESLDKLLHPREFSENDWKDKFSTPREVREAKSPSSNSAQSLLNPSPEEASHFGEGKILTRLKLVQSREDLLREVFVGLRFSFDLANGHVHLEMNVTPSSEKRSGFIIRF